MNGRDLTLGLVGALALGGIVGRRGSASATEIAAVLPEPGPPPAGMKPRWASSWTKGKAWAREQLLRHPATYDPRDALAVLDAADRKVVEDNTLGLPSLDRLEGKLRGGLIDRVRPKVLAEAARLRGVADRKSRGAASVDERAFWTGVGDYTAEVLGAAADADGVARAEALLDAVEANLVRAWMRRKREGSAARTESGMGPRKRSGSAARASLWHITNRRNFKPSSTFRPVTKGGWDRAASPTLYATTSPFYWTSISGGGGGPWAKGRKWAAELELLPGHPPVKPENPLRPQTILDPRFVRVLRVVPIEEAVREETGYNAKGEWVGKPQGSAARARLATPDHGRYRFVTNCIGSTYEDISALKETATEVSRATFARAVGPEQWKWIQKELGYDRDFRISGDWHVGYDKGTYRGVPAYWLTHSAIEWIFTLDGEQGKSKARRGSRTTKTVRAPAADVPAPVLTVLQNVGMEVGDHNRDYYLLLTADGQAHQVKLEGWGAECVEAFECSPAALRKAKSAARALAREWRRRWPEAGVVEHDDPNVWMSTWAWNGPLSEVGLARVLRDCAEEDVVDLRAGR